MILLLKRFHTYYFVSLIFIFFLLFYPFYYWASRKEERYLCLNKLRTAHSYIVSCLAGIFYNIKYDQALKADKTYIYCANHTSNLDIIILCLLAKGKFHFMGKEELKNNPVLGIFFNSIDVAVNRESKIASFRAFKKVGDNLAKQMSLIIFPEGKIDDVYPPKLHEFKNGPFRLAIEKKVEIVPVSINVWPIFWDSGLKYGSRPGIVDVYVHKPLATNKLVVENDEILKNQVFEQINSKLKG